MRQSLRDTLGEGNFKNVPVARSRTMAAIRSDGNQSTERRLRMALTRAGVRGWKVRPKGIYGRPDFVFLKPMIAIFVDGCFWHGCPSCGHVPTSNRPFWRMKLQQNRSRDQEVNAHLVKHGFRVVRIWECHLKVEPEATVELIRASLQ
jgi:DNA mismatch endonuclease, patch repair protein